MTTCVSLQGRRHQQQRQVLIMDDSKTMPLRQLFLLCSILSIIMISISSTVMMVHAYHLTNGITNTNMKNMLITNRISSQERRISFSMSTFGIQIDHHRRRPGCITTPFHRRIISQRLASTIEEDQQVPPQLPIPSTTTSSTSSYTLQSGQPTELPDSLSDAAIRAAEATKYYYDLMTSEGTITTIPVRGRIDFDTTLGDETFTLLKQSTPFVQQYVTALTYALIPQTLQQRQSEMMAVVQAKKELQQLKQQATSQSTVAVAEDSEVLQQQREQREDELIELIANNGRNITAFSAATTNNDDNRKPVIRIYFPDEGSAALARRDWTASIIPCLDYIEFRSCNGIQPLSSSSTSTSSVEVVAQIFVCPRASDSDAVERILATSENDVMMSTTATPQPQQRQSSLVSIFINPLLVDMGVTGFGYAGRRLRERLLDTLVGIYYLRTLPNGAMTRQYPSSYTIWQEDSNAMGGYICIANCQNRLPSNPEVIDIFDNYANGNDINSNNNGSGGGFLDQLGDFVNGMMRL